jgi:hypothetical protein
VACYGKLSDERNYPTEAAYLLIPVTYPKVLVQGIDVVHVSLTELKVKDSDVFLYPGLGDGFRNRCESLLNLPCNR